jgi:hypothetical protein
MQLPDWPLNNRIFHGFSQKCLTIQSYLKFRSVSPEQGEQRGTSAELVESTTGAGAFSFPVGSWLHFRAPPQSGLTWLRFLSPLIEPGVRDYRIQLFPTSSDLYNL